MGCLQECGYTKQIPMEMESENSLQWWVLVTVIIGTFLGSIDRTVVNLALPKIISAFSITVSTSAWIATAYILANAILVPVWGKLGDTIGRKKVYLTGFTIFIGSSLLAGISWSFGSLLFFRIIQGIAVSADYPTAMAILAVTFTNKKKRAQALGIWSASMASGAILGPLIGGPLIDTFGWRSVFFFNIPLGLIGMAIAIIFIKESASSKSSNSFDFFGAITLGIFLSAIVLVIDRGNTWGWTSASSLTSYSIAVIFAFLFYFIEKNSKDPIIDFSIFKNNAFVMTIINTSIVFMGMMGSVFLIPLFAETFLGYSATQTGYLFIPMAISIMIGAPFGAKLSNKIKVGKVIAIGTFIAAFGFLFFTLLDPRSGAIDIILPLSIMAFGLGMGMSARTNLIASSVPSDKVGTASSIFVLFRNVAGAFGVAVFATILSNKIENNVLDIAKNTIINSHTPIIYKTVVSLIILKAEVSAYADVFIIASILLFIGAIIALFIKIKNKKVE